MSHIPSISMKVASTLAANRIVVALSSTANTVAYPEAAGGPGIGITADTVLDTTGAIPVQIAGKAKLLFNDTVTTGQLVAADTSGRGIPHVDVTAGSWVIGRLIGPTVAATGTIAEVLIQPGFKSIP